MNHDTIDASGSQLLWQKIFRITIMLLAGGSLIACENPNFPGDQANDRLAITNNPETLFARVNYTSNSLTIDNGSYVISQPAAARAASGEIITRVMAANTAQASLSLKLVAEIDSPVVDGQVVQATSISMSEDDSAVVSYNMRGAPRLGAIDLISFSHSSTPSLSSSVILSDSDVSSVTTDENDVYAAVATDAPEFTGPAVVERFKIKRRRMVLDENRRAQLNSFAATSTTVTKNTLYTTSGDGGDVSAFKLNTLELLGSYPLDDARWVTRDKKGKRIVVVQGTPGRLSVFEEGVFPAGSMNLLNTFSFTGANIAESKSTVEIAGGKAFIAAGTDGVQIMCLDDGRILGNIPRPDPASLGLDPSVVVTNSVTIDDDLVFISNGEAGVYVAQATDEFKKTDCSDPLSITMLGKLRFGNLESVNHVVYEDKYLYVAAGIGGVKVVKVKLND